MDTCRRLIPLLSDDPSAQSMTLVGIWVSGLSFVLDPAAIAACLRFRATTRIQDRALSDDALLVLFYGHGDYSAKLYECIEKENTGFSLFSCRVFERNANSKNNIKWKLKQKKENEFVNTLPQKSFSQFDTKSVADVEKQRTKPKNAYRNDSISYFCIGMPFDTQGDEKNSYKDSLSHLSKQEVELSNLGEAPENILSSVQIEDRDSFDGIQKEDAETRLHDGKRVGKESCASEQNESLLFLPGMHSNADVAEKGSVSLHDSEKENFDGNDSTSNKITNSIPSVSGLKEDEIPSDSIPDERSLFVIPEQTHLEREVTELKNKVQKETFFVSFSPFSG